MTTTELDTREDVLTGLSTIEGVDLDLEVQCEDENPDHRHEHPADLRVRFICPCGDRPMRFLCLRSYDQYRAAMPRHLGCGLLGDVIILEHLR